MGAKPLWERAVMLQQAPQPGTRQCPQGHHQGGGNLPKSAITRFRIRVVHTRGRPLRKALVWCCSAALMDDCAQLCQDWQQHHLIAPDRQRQRPGKLSLGEVLFNDGALPSLPRQGPQAFLPLWGGAGVPPPFAELSRHQQICGPDGAGPTGASPMGGFFGFKLHLPINHRGQIMAFKITGGNAGCPPTVGAHDGCSTGQARRQ